MKPKVDIAFKEIMEDEKARTGFLSAMLKIEPEEIKSTRILNTNLRKEHEDDKQGILDVRLLLNDESEIYPRAIKFTRILGARGHIRAINLAKHNVREYRYRDTIVTAESLGRAVIILSGKDVCRTDLTGTKL